MAHIPHNVERIGDHYVAYDSTGYAFRVTRPDPRQMTQWRAAPSHVGRSRDPRFFFAPTLRDLARKVRASTL